MTYPLIGNYGVNSQDVESLASACLRFCHPGTVPGGEQLAGGRLAVRVSGGKRDSGIQGIDTRALTKKLRVRGRAERIYHHGRPHGGRSGGAGESWPGLMGVDYVREVTHRQAFRWDEKDEQSASLKLVRGTAGRRPGSAQTAAAGGSSDCGV